MGFWKEMGVKALEKGKGLFRGGKQATEAAKHTEEIGVTSKSVWIRHRSSLV